MRASHRLTLFFLFAGSAAPAFAQQAPPRAPRQQADASRPRHERLTPEQRVARHVQRLDQQLNLSDRQEAQIRRILLDQAAQHQRQMTQHREARPQQPRPEGARAVRPQITPEQRQQRQSAMRAEFEQTQRAIVAVLTPQQAEQYRRFQAEQRTRAQQQRGQRQERRSARTPDQGRGKR